MSEVIGEIVEHTYKDIWENLSRVDVSSQAKKKNGLTYLSWAWAWGVLMEHYPDAQYHFADEQYEEQGSCMVYCTITIGQCRREMWLPVMDYRNKAIPNPSMRDISDTRMRALTKCMGMFGLGHYIYAGEDLPPEGPDATKSKPSKKAKPKASPDSETGPKDDDHWRAVEETVLEFMKNAKDFGDLKKYWFDNEEALKDMEVKSVDRYKNVLEQFSAMKDSFNNN